jgi:uncharacterized protein with PIN domain
MILTGGVTMNFEELFEEIMSRAKTVADTAGKKTGEVVDMGKLRYQIKQTEWDIEKTYAKLGAIVYESRQSHENFDEVIDLAISEIDALNERQAELEERLRTYKKVSRCPGCGKENDLNSTYCSRCGTSIDVEVKEPYVAEVIPEEDRGGDI